MECQPSSGWGAMLAEPWAVWTSAPSRSRYCTDISSGPAPSIRYWKGGAVRETVTPVPASVTVKLSMV